LGYGALVFNAHYVIKFVSELQHVSGFLRVLWFPPPIKLTAMIERILFKKNKKLVVNKNNLS
jgi:hypothetical protein